MMITKHSAQKGRTVGGKLFMRISYKSRIKKNIRQIQKKPNNRYKLKRRVKRYYSCSEKKIIDQVGGKVLKNYMEWLKTFLLTLIVRRLNKEEKLAS